MSASEEEECAAWRNGTRGTWSDPRERISRRSEPGGFTSQNAQDKLLWDGIFSRLGRVGRYVDLAANHYKRISNTYFLDVCAGWDGICVEPNPIYHAGLRANRSCRLVPMCISDSTVEVDILLPPFQWMGGLGGIGNGTLKSQLRGRRAPLLSFYPPSKWKQTRMTCSTLGLELASSGWQHVDFLSLDVEGHEDAVLRGVDWSKVRIDHILCERGCDAVLRPLGYTPRELETHARTSPGASATTELLWTHPDVAARRTPTSTPLGDGRATPTASPSGTDAGATASTPSSSSPTNDVLSLYSRMGDPAVSERSTVS